MMVRRKFEIISWLSTFVIIFLFSRCAHKDSCNIPCFNGACINNSCSCNTGYEGDSCTVATTEKFIGSYSATDLCDSNVYGYTVTIAAATSIPNQIIITNFGEFGSTFFITASISGFTFTVASQTLEGITLSGSGTIDTVAKTITASYTAMDELNQMTSCTGTWLRQ